MSERAEQVGIKRIKTARAVGKTTGELFHLPWLLLASTDDIHGYRILGPVQFFCLILYKSTGITCYKLITLQRRSRTGFNTAGV
jgi:hypothetical protein